MNRPSRRPARPAIDEPHEPPVPPEAAEWPVAPELQVNDAAVAELLWHPARRRQLAPFLGRSSTLAEAAAELGMGKPAMSYWIKRLLALGLIRPRGTTRLQRGRAVVQYRCVADCLRLSLRDAPLSSYEAIVDDSSALLREQTRQALGQALQRQSRWLEMRLQAHPATGMGIVVAPCGEGMPPDDCLHYWGRLWLAPEEARALRDELDRLWDRFSALSDRQHKRQRMLLQMVAVPEASP